ncbi:hypothetical protein J3E64_000002 [Sphingobium sp. OAS761]|nr:hypothetical protein [Sphingobium sp. OAS761]
MVDITSSTALTIQGESNSMAAGPALEREAR